MWIKMLIFAILISLNLNASQWQIQQKENYKKFLNYDKENKSQIWFERFEYKNSFFYHIVILFFEEMKGFDLSDNINISLYIDDSKFISKKASILSVENGIVRLLLMEDSFEDFGIIENMKKGNSMKVSMFIEGKQIIKEFSLKGFTRGYNRMYNSPKIEYKKWYNAKGEDENIVMYQFLEDDGQAIITKMSEVDYYFILKNPKLKRFNIEDNIIGLIVDNEFITSKEIEYNNPDVIYFKIDKNDIEFMKAGNELFIWLNTKNYNNAKECEERIIKIKLKNFTNSFKNLKR